MKYKKSKTVDPPKRKIPDVKLPEFTVSDTGLHIPIAGHDLDGVARNVDDVTFQLHFLCEIPILTFHFKKTWDVEVIPVLFNLFDNWPVAEKLIINLNLENQEACKKIDLSEDETASIIAARNEQAKMSSRQIAAIVDLIYCGYFGFSEKPEVQL